MVFGFGSVASATGALITNMGWVRKNNEDACLFGRTFSLVSMKTPLEAICRGNHGWIVAVADGVGGQNAGERASHEVVTGLYQCTKFSEKEITEVLTKLDARFLAMGRQDERFSKMGSVVAGLCCNSKGVQVFNVGDSRAYQLKNGMYEQVSVDDTIAQKREQPGVDENDAEYVSVISQCIGGKSDARSLSPHFLPVVIKTPTRFLLCSDGISDVLTPADLSSLAGAGIPPVKAVSAVFEAARVNGTQDNVSIIVVDVHP